MMRVVAKVAALAHCLQIFILAFLRLVIQMGDRQDNPRSCDRMILAMSGATAGKALSEIMTYAALSFALTAALRALKANALADRLPPSPPSQSRS
jgi:hypothetical protein